MLTSHLMLSECVSHSVASTQVTLLQRGTMNDLHMQMTFINMIIMYTCRSLIKRDNTRYKMKEVLGPLLHGNSSNPWQTT
jgi:hypothetical protein